VTLSEEVYEGLARRLAEFGAPDAAERLLGHRAIRYEDKAVVREVLARWLRTDGDEQLGRELAELHDRLGQEIKRHWRTSRSTRPMFDQ
jgi:hypothetical protein